MKYISKVEGFDVPFEKSSNDRFITHVDKKIRKYPNKDFSDGLFSYEIHSTTEAEFTLNDKDRKRYNYLRIESKLFSKKKVSYWFLSKIEGIVSENGTKYDAKLDVIATFGLEVFKSLEGKRLLVERAHEDRYKKKGDKFLINKNHHSLVNSDFKVPEHNGMKVLYDGCGNVETVEEYTYTKSGDVADIKNVGYDKVDEQNSSLNDRLFFTLKGVKEYKVNNTMRSYDKTMYVYGQLNPLGEPVLDSLDKSSYEVFISTANKVVDWCVRGDKLVTQEYISHNNNDVTFSFKVNGVEKFKDVFSYGSVSFNSKKNSYVDYDILTGDIGYTTNIHTASFKRKIKINKVFKSIDMDTDSLSMRISKGNAYYINNSKLYKNLNYVSLSSDKSHLYVKGDDVYFILNTTGVGSVEKNSNTLYIIKNFVGKNNSVVVSDNSKNIYYTDGDILYLNGKVIHRDYRRNLIYANSDVYYINKDGKISKNGNVILNVSPNRFEVDNKGDIYFNLKGIEIYKTKSHSFMNNGRSTMIVPLDVNHLNKLHFNSLHNMSELQKDKVLNIFISPYRFSLNSVLGGDQNIHMKLENNKEILYGLSSEVYKNSNRNEMFRVLNEIALLKFDKNTFNKDKIEIALLNSDLNQLTYHLQNVKGVKIDVVNYLRKPEIVMEAKFNEQGIVSTHRIGMNQYITWAENNLLSFFTDQAKSFLARNKSSISSQKHLIDLQSQLQQKQIQSQQASNTGGGVIGGLLSMFNPTTWVNMSIQGSEKGVVRDIASAKKGQIDNHIKDLSNTSGAVNGGSEHNIVNLMGLEYKYKWNWKLNKMNDILARKIVNYHKRFGYKFNDIVEFKSKLWTNMTTFNYIKIKDLRDSISGTVDIDSSIIELIDKELEAGIRIFHTDKIGFDIDNIEKTLSKLK